MTAVIIVLVLCMIVESMIIMVLLEQRRQVVLQLKLLRQALEWRMEDKEGIEKVSSFFFLVKQIVKRKTDCYNKA